MRVRSSILGTIVLAGCYAHPTPKTTVRPATVVRAAPATSPATTARPQQAGSPTSSRAGADSSAVTGVEVARRALDIFGDTLVLTPVPVFDSSAAAPSWDMDVRSYETQARVAHYVAMFTGRSKDRIVDRLERGTRYEAMIRAKMREGGLPEDMYYLALIESGFDPNAYSRAAAVGMWQFMTSTARGVGMRVDWWVDERRDPVRSTAGAVRFLRGLRNQFGSLYLAAAAYNGGPGRVARGLARYADDLDDAASDDAFFVLAEKDYLRNETREYVPQLIAAALIAKDPVRYDMTLRPRPVFAYDSVRVPGETPLSAVARGARVSGREIAELNTHLLRGMTPPGPSTQVRIPVGTLATFDSIFRAIPEDDRVGTRVVETRTGDTAEGLARELGLPVSMIRGFNPDLRRAKSGRLVSGQRVLVPTPAVAALALSIPDPAVEIYPRSTARVKVHTVRRGETLGAVARRYSMSTQRMMRLNGLRKPVIFPGQTLLLSAPAASARSSRSTAAARRSESRSGASRAVRARSAGAKSAKSAKRPKAGASGRKGAKSVKSTKAKTSKVSKITKAGSGSARSGKATGR